MGYCRHLTGAAWTSNFVNTVTQERGSIGLGKVGMSVTLNSILDVYLLSDMKILSGSLLTVCSEYCCLLAFGELG